MGVDVDPAGGDDEAARVDLAKVRITKVVDRISGLLALAENNALIVYSKTLAGQIPPSSAGHAFNVFQKAMHSHEIVQLCALWDKPDGTLAHNSIPTVHALIDDDAVIDVLFYHDTVWIGTDREKMNRAIFNALRPGGIYGIVDHSAAPGSGLSVVQTLHRIEESTLRAEVEHAGFKLVEEASFLKNPNDARDWSDSPRVAGERRGTSDRFVLKFKKP